MKHHFTLAVLAFCGSATVFNPAYAQFKAKTKVAPKAKPKQATKTYAERHAEQLAELWRAVKEADKDFEPSPEGHGNSLMIHKPSSKYRYLSFKSSK